MPLSCGQSSNWNSADSRATSCRPWTRIAPLQATSGLAGTDSANHGTRTRPLQQGPPRLPGPPSHAWMRWQPRRACFRPAKVGQRHLQPVDAGVHVLVAPFHQPSVRYSALEVPPASTACRTRARTSARSSRWTCAWTSSGRTERPIRMALRVTCLTPYGLGHTRWSGGCELWHTSSGGRGCPLPEPAPPRGSAVARGAPVRVRDGGRPRTCGPSPYVPTARRPGDRHVRS